MQVEIFQENLAKAVSQVARVINPLPQLPILNNLYLKTGKRGISLVGTNLETTISLFLPAKVSQEGETTVSAKNFSEMVGAMRAEKIKLVLKKNRLHLISKAGKAKFPTMSAKDFPAKDFPQTKKRNKKRMVFSGKELLESLRKTVFAAAMDESRPALAGVLMEAGKKGARLVATDGYRLSLAKIKVREGKLTESAIIPARALRELEKGIAEKGEVEVVSDKEGAQVYFSQGDFLLGTRLIEGDFPDFEKIIPDQGATKVEVDREGMVERLRTAAIFARESANIVHLEIDEQGVSLVAKAQQAGEGSFQLEVEKQEGEGLKIAFNFRFLLEALAAFEEETVVIEFSGSLAPAKFYSPKKPEVLHIVMPVRLQE